MLSGWSLQGLGAEVRLGWGAEERSEPQGVSFDVELRFAELPRASFTDDLGDTVCYAGVAAALREVCARGEYRLIERLGREAHVRVRELCPPQSRLRVRVTKLKPPVAELTGGASFEVADAGFFPGSGT